MRLTENLLSVLTFTALAGAAAEINLSALSKKSLKTLFSQNHIDCTGCSQKQDWVERAEEALDFGSISEEDIRRAVRRSKASRTKFEGPASASAPDGGLQMTREEFRRQLLNSMQGKGEQLDEKMVDNLWTSFAQQLHNGELKADRPTDWSNYIHWASMLAVLLMLLLRKRDRDNRRKQEEEGSTTSATSQRKSDEGSGSDAVTDSDRDAEEEVAALLQKALKASNQEDAKFSHDEAAPRALNRKRRVKVSQEEEGRSHKLLAVD